MTDRGPDAGRRDFLKGGLIVGAAGLAPASAPAAAQEAQEAVPARALVPGAETAHAEIGLLEIEAGPHAQVRDPGSDVMVDLLRAAGIEYVAAMAGSTFRGLHESIVNYGANRQPEFITCVHEEISAAMAHGYAKASGKVMACLVHSNVGLQHASMAIYNAYADRAPIIVLAGNPLDAATRRPWIEWLHAQTDLATMVRDFIKWDDTPVSLQHYAESFVRACEIATTPPYGPVLVVVDSDLQEHPVGTRPSIPRMNRISPPAGETSAIEQAAAWLAGAEAPVIVADRAARTAEGMRLIVELAETLVAPVIDKYGRLNMPTNHYLCQTFRQGPLIAGADVILGLEVTDIWGTVNAMPDTIVRTPRRITGQATKVIAISSNYGFVRGNVQDVQRHFAADLMMAADAEACLPQLIAAVRRHVRRGGGGERARRREALRAAFQEMRAAAAREAALSWNASPIGTGRLCMELWDQIKGLDWALVSHAGFASFWPQRLWDFTKHYQFIGADGAYGVGYGAPAAAGAALAHRDAGRIPVAIQTDGDLMVLPGTLWTLAHHNIPLLSVMHNNRAWHQETMHIQRMANRRDRGVDNARIGTVLEDPVIDYAKMAQSMGVWAEGPVDDPDNLSGAIARALDVVKSGKPALVDVVTQPR